MNQPLPSGFTDPWPEILHLLPQKITYKGAPVNGDVNTLKGFAAWLIQSLPGVAGSGEADTKANSFLLWLRSESHYEADTATRMAQQAAAPPAAPPTPTMPAPAPTPMAPPNPISSQTVPQMAQMAAPTPQPVAAPAPAADAPETGPGMKCPECGTDVSGVRGFKRHVTMTHKVDWPAFCTKYGLDQKTALPGTAPVAAAPAPASAPPPPPQAQPVPPMFQATGPAQPFVAPAPPPMPASMPTPPATVQGAPTVPTMGVAPPAQPIPSHGPMVAFNPAAPAPPPVINPGLPGQQQVPFQQQAPVAPAPAPTPTVNFAGPSRDDLAKMLGGAVDLIIVRLLDASTVNLAGRVDVNQIAAVAEAKAKSEMKVVDLAQASYGAGKQAAQRHFAELLTAAPGCYLLLNGYEPIIPAGYLEILAARVTKFHIVTDAGRQTTTIF